jgi:hypothetical protein
VCGFSPPQSLGLSCRGSHAVGYGRKAGHRINTIPGIWRHLFPLSLYSHHCRQFLGAWLNQGSHSCQQSADRRWTSHQSLTLSQAAKRRLPPWKQGPNNCAFVLLVRPELGAAWSGLGQLEVSRWWYLLMVRALVLRAFVRRKLRARQTDFKCRVILELLLTSHCHLSPDIIPTSQVYLWMQYVRECIKASGEISGHSCSSKVNS